LAPGTWQAALTNDKGETRPNKQTRVMSDSVAARRLPQPFHSVTVVKIKTRKIVILFSGAEN
jgi:hypothetical protein